MTNHPVKHIADITDRDIDDLIVDDLVRLWSGVGYEGVLDAIRMYEADARAISDLPAVLDDLREEPLIVRVLAVAHLYAASSMRTEIEQFACIGILSKRSPFAHVRDLAAPMRAYGLLLDRDLTRLNDILRRKAAAVAATSGDKP